MKTEKGRPYEFADRAYLKDIYDCWTESMVVKKAAQVGMTSFAMNKALWLAAVNAITVIFTMPTAKMVSDFSQGRLNPSLRHSRLDVPMRTDNVGIKQIGDSFIYLLGTWNEKQAISVPSDFNIHDEIDRSRPDIREMYAERLSASEIAWQLDMSTPTYPNYGISALYNETDKREWFVSCPCGKEQVLSLDNIMEGEYRCLKCREVLDRTKGEWRTTAEGNRVGYHITQLMAPWISGAKLLQKIESYNFKRDGYNFVLGEEYAGGEGLVTRADIIGCLASAQALVGNASIGVDWGDVTWVVVRKAGHIVYLAKIEGDTRTHAGQVAELMDKFDAECVADFGYGDTKNKELIEKFPGRVWMCIYKEGAIYPEFKDTEKGPVVHIDRTRSLQESMQEMKDQAIGIFENEHMDEFIAHHLNLTEEETEDKHGEKRTVIGRSGPDHFAHSNNYARLRDTAMPTIDDDDVDVADVERTFGETGTDYTDWGELDV